MKWIAVVALIFTSIIAMAKTDMDFKTFNKKMNENIQHVLKENPHLYETKDIYRKPASAIEAVEHNEKLDEIEHQETGKNAL